MTKLTFIQLLLSILLFVGLVATYGFWYRLVGVESVEAARLSTEIDAKSLESSRIASAKTALATLDAQESGVGQYFVETKEIVPFLESLESTGKALGAAVTVASVSADTNGAHPHLTLSLKIAGSFDSVLRTLGAIEYGPYDSELLSLTFDTPRQEGTTGSWTATATFSIGTRNTK